MRNFISTKVRTVFDDFLQTAEAVGGLCACKHLTYEGGRRPDYTDALVQQSYMLRFFPAYLAEYFLMYSDMIGLTFLPRPYKVLSIGCGCGVDLWGLFYAVQEAGFGPDATINYTGIDIVNWTYRERLGLDNVRFLHQSITEWEQIDDEDYNVVTFPKCIGEFPDAVFDSICDMFSNSEFTEDRICILCSLMEQGMELDARRFRRIAQILHDVHGYDCLDDLDEYYAQGNEGIVNVCPEFQYPNEILPVVARLGSQCPTFAENGEGCEPDCGNLNRYPILRASFMNYQIIRFQRP